MHQTSETLELIGNQKLVVERTPTDNTLKVFSSDGHLCFSISITSAGPVLRFESQQVVLESAGDVALAAKRLVLHGREGVVVSTGGDLRICAAGDLSSEARVQDITARLGNVNVKANDDVKLTGERIKMNC